MAKGIIVVDVPESCIKCEYCNSDGYCKVAHKDVFAFGPREKKSDWCPICPIIEEKDMPDGGQAFVKKNLYFNSQIFNELDIVKVSRANEEIIEGRIMFLETNTFGGNFTVATNDHRLRHIMATDIINCELVERWKGFYECT